MGGLSWSLSKPTIVQPDKIQVDMSRLPQQSFWYKWQLEIKKGQKISTYCANGLFRLTKEYNSCFTNSSSKSKTKLGLISCVNISQLNEAAR